MADMRTGGRRGLYFFLLVAFSAGILGAWSQPWFELDLGGAATSVTVLSVSGQVAAPALSAVGLASLAAVAALAIGSPFVRRIVSFVVALLGLSATIATALAIADPVTASNASLSKLTAIADIASLRLLVGSVSVSAWPWVCLACGGGLVVVGILLMWVAPNWPRGGRKYASTPGAPARANASDSAAPIDLWDGLSEGGDPTVR
jgi:hypothetical protein